MRKIPDDLRTEMANDPYYKKCALTGTTDGKIDWHHNLIYAGRQVNEKWCIIPLSKPIHDRIDYYKDKVDWIMLNRATDDELRAYSKAIDLITKRNRLNKLYGETFRERDTTNYL